ncbi:MAG: hypothetical protein QF816_05820, partial [Candidatus Scalindua sp.]|nr:hypothetical protein [Candidatus Scalindua sp.]
QTASKAMNKNDRFALSVIGVSNLNSRGIEKLRLCESSAWEQNQAHEGYNSNPVCLRKLI